MVHHPAVVALWPVGLAGSRSMRRPNVLLVTLDQWRGDCLGSAGHQSVSTPHLDGLAADGVRFAAHHAQAAPCGPSRASLLTGTYQHAVSYTHLTLPTILLV